jgi:hypothetical protein
MKMSQILRARVLSHPEWWLFLRGHWPPDDKEHTKEEIWLGAKVILEFDKDIDPAEEKTTEHFKLEDIAENALHIVKTDPEEFHEANPDQIIGIWFDGYLVPESVKETDAIKVDATPKTEKEDK